MMDMNNKIRATARMMILSNIPKDWECLISETGRVKIPGRSRPVPEIRHAPKTLDFLLHLTYPEKSYLFEENVRVRYRSLLLIDGSTEQGL